MMKLPSEKTVDKPSNAQSNRGSAPEEADASWDHSTHSNFYDYYARQSETEEAQQRCRGVRDNILKVLSKERSIDQTLDVVDIGCGAGTQSMIWAELGHSVHGLDINEPLVELGKERAAKAGFAIDFRVGSATALPWSDQSADICVALELLEHVADWRGCLNEFIRILRPGGALYVTTTNQLCPVQAEFNLPFYSWYPAPLKRHYEKLAVTTRPEIANFARYPAVNWFTFYSLRDFLAESGLRCLDRFEMINLDQKGASQRLIVHALRSVPPLRRLGHVCTRGTRILAVKSR